MCSSEPGAKAGAKVRPLGSSWFPVPFACGDGHGHKCHGDHRRTFLGYLKPPACLRNIRSSPFSNFWAISSNTVPYYTQHESKLGTQKLASIQIPNNDQQNWAPRVVLNFCYTQLGSTIQMPNIILLRTWVPKLGGTKCRKVPTPESVTGKVSGETILPLYVAEMFRLG